jgi:predicted DNA-binding transcriptional regulator AlpA
MKALANQYVRSSKWMLLIGLTLLVVLLILAPGGRHSNESKVVRAKQNAEVLGFQLAQIYNLEKNKRRPASGSVSEISTLALEEVAGLVSEDEVFKGEGLIGLDPWGQPYKYNVLKTDQGVARIVVMSDGPISGRGPQNETDADQSSEKIKVVITPAE